MTVLSKIERDVKAPRIVVLPPSAFTDDWPGKPPTEVAIGLRFISQSDLDTAVREAERVRVGFYNEVSGHQHRPDPETLIDVYNEALMMGAIARATCDPNDVRKPYFQAADDTVKMAFTPEGARRVWDEYVLLTVGSGVARRRADDREVGQLGKLLASAEAGLELTDEMRVLLAHITDSLALKEVQMDDEDEVDLDEEDAGRAYVTRRAATSH